MVSAFAAMTKEQMGAVIVSADTMLFMNRTRIAALAAQRRLPSVAPNRDFVEAGGLVSSGVILPDLYRHAASYVDKSLKGAKSGDLSKALGLTIPQSVLGRADGVIQ